MAKDLFISYSKYDEAYATWIAEILESEGISVTIQAWDFLPGDNFVAKINQALIECEKLIIVLSKHYLDSAWCQEEWTSKLSQKDALKERRIIPVKIEQVEVKGLLNPIVYINLVDKDEADAKKLILEGVFGTKERQSAGFPPNLYVQYTEKHLDYTIYDDHIVIFQRYKVKILADKCNRHINRKIEWFKDEDIRIESVTEGVTIQDINIIDTVCNYSVVFDHDLKKDEQVEFTITTTVTNNNHHFENIISQKIMTPIKKFVINIHFPTLPIKTIYTQIIADNQAKVRTSSPETHTFDRDFVWELKDPEPHCMYEISWNTWMDQIRLWQSRESNQTQLDNHTQNT